MTDKKELSPIELLQPNEKSLMSMVSTYKDRMMKRASDSLRNSSPDKQDQFLMRTIASIIKNDNLKDCFNTHQGKVSIYMLIDDCLKTGLELEKHAYAIPYSKKVRSGNADIWIKEASFQIKREGYHALLCGGEKPIFKDLLWGVVYEKEKNNIKINRATGEVDHPIFIDEDRGKAIGCWVQAIHLDGKKEAEFYPVSRIFEIRDNHSKTYQDYLAKKVSTSAWVTDEIPMIEKTAIKAFCRPYADVKDELANAFYSEREENIPENVRSMEDIASEIADESIENFKEAKRNVKEEIPEEKEPEFGNIPDAKEPKKEEKKKQTLF